MHLKGWGTKPDAAKAIQLFDAAAKSGNMLAAYNLAMLHLGGHTVERAPCQAAVALLKKVAEKGFPAQQVQRRGGFAVAEAVQRQVVSAVFLSATGLHNARVPAPIRCFLAAHPAFLPFSCLPACLPTCNSSIFLSSFLPACLPACRRPTTISRLVTTSGHCSTT
jgi:hypothetical protein